jgi:hypothetical protein
MNLASYIETETAAFIIAACLYELVAAAPLWWPTFIALRRRPQLPRRLLFVGVVAGLSYGIIFLSYFLLGFPAEIYSLFVAPSLQQMGHSPSKLVVTVAQYVEQYGWFAMPPLLLVLTFALTNKLAKRWHRICDGLHG